MKKIHVKFTSIVEVDQVFTVTDEVAEQISKRDLKSSSFDQEEHLNFMSSYWRITWNAKQSRQLI
jgi:hypothetical protein